MLDAIGRGSPAEAPSTSALRASADKGANAGVKAIPARPNSLPDEARNAKAGPRSKLGKPGMRGRFKKRRR